MLLGPRCIGGDKLLVESVQRLPTRGQLGVQPLTLTEQRQRAQGHALPRSAQLGPNQSPAG